MSHDRGIITVVGQNEEQDDEDLVALRQIPRFEPLVVPELPSQFSLASVFGSLSVSRHSDVGEQAFNPNTLVDILVQVNAHNKRCVQDIQDYQRLLAIKMKTLDDYTASAVQELGSIHQRAKTNSDQLLSVHALEKQARITTSFLHGIVDKLAFISERLPPEPGNKETSLESYPNLQRYLQQVPQPYSHDTLEPGQRNQSGSAGREGHHQPSGLDLLGHNTNYQHHSIQKSNYRMASPLLASPSSITTTTARASALSIPKARASMALASSSMDFLPSHATAVTHTTLSNRELSSGLNDSQQDIPRSSTTGNLPETGATTRTSTTPSRLGPFSGTTTIVSPQPPTLPPRASDNLRKLANKSPQPSSSEYF
ncbi:hypothetical protein BG000_007258 [Podila horticola]|nr:hypothetical protein BG000_007258 [Podila horticola]